MSARIVLAARREVFEQMAADVQRDLHAEMPDDTTMAEAGSTDAEYALRDELASATRQTLVAVRAFLAHADEVQAHPTWPDRIWEARSEGLFHAVYRAGGEALKLANKAAAL